MGVASLATIASGGIARAQDSTPEDGETSPEAGPHKEVLLTGLADPRFVVVDGSDVYFTEAGTGGDEPIYLVAGEGTPDANDPVSYAGFTGKVSRLSGDGTVTVISDELFSYTFGAAGEINGPAGLALDGAGSVYVSMSTGPSMFDIPRTGNEGVLLKIDIETGDQEVIADLMDWESAHNPDPISIESNPYGMCLVDGVAYIADASGNSIIAVDVDSREMTTFAVTGGVPVDFFPEAGNPARAGADEIDSVPSSVKPGPDGRLYVSYVTGGPFPPGTAPIDAFSLDGEMERVVEGLTMTGDLAFDSAGRLYASIISTDLINGGPGQVIRIEEDGSTTVVIDGLAMTAGIAFDADDNLYVINKSSLVPGGGELVKYSSVTEVAASDGGTVEDDAGEISNENPSRDDNSYHITFIDTAFEPNALTIPADIDVTLTLENTGFLAHDFVLANPKIVSDVLLNGETTELVLNLPAGEYTFYCAQIGHRAMGMVGTLTVV